MILFKSEDLGISAKNYANNSENKKKTFWNSNQNRQKCLCCIKWWSRCNLSANFAPEDFLRSNDIKVRRSNTIFYRELQNCEKSLGKSKNVKR